MRFSVSLPIVLALGLCAAPRAQAQNAAMANADGNAKPLGTPPLRTLIISGGPNFQYNQYAIESNARYVEKLTQDSAWRRIHFADGKPNSRTIAVTQSSPASQANRALALVLGEDLPAETIVAQASTLGRIDGASTKPVVGDALAAFCQPAPGQQGLLYFTGHGSPGGTRRRPDYRNTTFALWNDDQISAREVARAIGSWPAQNPLFIVMVQCHSGGFANLLFQDGDPTKPLLDRDIAGFFSSTGERVAAGCTSEVNERDYQDFTTHFFAALSGLSRDGRPVSGADYDGSGQVSGSEAFAWANVHDLSVDVPVATSDAFLRAANSDRSNSWQKTPYSRVIADALPWQKAMLDQLSDALGLSGETRIADAIARHDALQASDNDDEFDAPDVDEKAVEARLMRLKTNLQGQFPGLRDAPKSASYRAARQDALVWMSAHPPEVNAINDAIAAYTRAVGQKDVRVAMLERFVRGAYSVVLARRLSASGTPQQQAFLARLRTAEARNPLL